MSEPAATNREYAMPFFKGDFTAEQLEAMRKAAAECSAAAGVGGQVHKERDIALAILATAVAGRLTHDEMVAAGLAALRGNALN